MLGPAPFWVSAEDVGEAADRDRGVEAGRIDLLDRGSEQDVHPELGGERGVALLVPGVGAEVLSRPELRRVHEERDDHGGAVLAGATHQRQVTLVEGAHRRRQADQAAAAHGPEDGAKVADRPHRLHATASIVRRPASARVRSTSSSKSGSTSGADSATAAR